MDIRGTLPCPTNQQKKQRNEINPGLAASQNLGISLAGKTLPRPDLNAVTNTTRRKPEEEEETVGPQA
jgi:hypothetical protein